ncbi:MAG: N-acetylmuramoyl-L-alanine amidase [Elusimicrobiota bacterium]|nr:N-acetylmuramoyl-L-alanine amidase [Elusimicrobiota bacterium]
MELMGDFDLQRPSVAQLRSAAKLVAWPSAAHGIAPARVRTHQDATPGQTNCPGKDFRRYMSDGQFLFWVNEARDGLEPAVAPGLPLPDGPTAPIAVP